MIIWMGIWRLGAVVCPLNVEINSGHIKELLQSIEPKLTLWHTDLDGAALTDGVGGEVMRFDRWGDGTITGTDQAEFFTAVAATIEEILEGLKLDETTVDYDASLYKESDEDPAADGSA